MKPLIRILLVIAFLVIAGELLLRWKANRDASAPVALPPPTMQTLHYAISSTADAEKTQRVAAAVESLHTAYREFFSLTDVVPRHKLRLVLYRDQAEFKAHNRSAPWAEAYYLAPACHAYYQDGTANPYHWMLHEAVHQLNREFSDFQRRRWSDEGLAAYFATSELRDGKLVLGELDFNTYPLWWLPKLRLSGDRHQDIAQGRLIPLRSLITDTGPPIAQHVNLYYIEYWSLVHYLLHREGGRDAPAFRALMAEGATLESFEKRFGPIEAVEAGWYEHLRRMVPREPLPPKDVGAVSVEIGG